MRTDSIHRNLIFRLFVTSILLSSTIGYLTYLNQNRQLGDRIAERAQLALEILKLETKRLLEADIGSINELPVQQALDNLIKEIPQSKNGRYAFIIIHDSNRRELARYVAPDIAFAPQLAQALLERGLKFPSAGAEFGAFLHISGTPDLPIAMVVTDKQSKPIAYANGVYVLSSKAQSDLYWSVFRAVAVAIGIVLITTILIYPVIRGLTTKLTNLAMHLLDANVDTIKTLGSAIAKRDSDTDAHNYRVTVYAVHMAEALGLDAKTIRTLIKGAFLHDVGKIGIRDYILHKPGRLNDDEFSIMQRHVEHGLDILQKAIWLEDAAEVVGNHHEKYDGSGYPGGLRGDAIPLTARIFAIVDVFDALTSERPYKKPFPLIDTLGILRRAAGSHFDPELIGQFERLAPSLYERFATRDQEARKELELIIRRYYQGDLGEIMVDVPLSS
ncbi:HD-GYP domain-containing protein [Methylomonas sp. MgM2]